MAYCAKCGVGKHKISRTWYAIEAACFVDQSTYTKLLADATTHEEQEIAMREGWNQKCGIVPNVLHLSMRSLTVYGITTADKAIRRVLTETFSGMLSDDYLKPLEEGDKRVRWLNIKTQEKQPPNDAAVQFTNFEELSKQLELAKQTFTNA